MIGDFSLQATSQNKLLREKLEAIFQEWRVPFASCIGEAQTAGEIDSTFEELQNCRVVPLGSGRHYLQEDHAEVIGATVNEWLIDLGVGSSPKHKLTFSGRN